MELKYASNERIADKTNRSNRTFMELKSHCNKLGHENQA